MNNQNIQKSQTDIRFYVDHSDMDVITMTIYFKNPTLYGIGEIQITVPAVNTPGHITAPPMLSMYKVLCS